MPSRPQISKSPVSINSWIHSEVCALAWSGVIFRVSVPRHTGRRRITVISEKKISRKLHECQTRLFILPSSEKKAVDLGDVRVQHYHPSDHSNLFCFKRPCLFPTSNPTLDQDPRTIFVILLISPLISTKKISGFSSSCSSTSSIPAQLSFNTFLHKTAKSTMALQCLT